MHTESADFRRAPKRRNVKESSHAWNRLPQNVPECSLFHAGLIVNISWKPVDAFSRNITNRQTDKLPNKDENITFAVRWR